MADPHELQAHPLNWRQHPEQQATGLRAVLDEVGIVQQVVVSKRTGRILDGHLRVDAAIATGQREIPIVEVDVSEDEERLILATFDSLGEMAQVDPETLRSLLGTIETDNDAIAGVLEALCSNHDLELAPTVANPPPAQRAPSTEWVEFRFGDVKGRVAMRVYRAFQNELRRRQSEGGEVLLSDVLARWLSLSQIATATETPAGELEERPS